MLSLGRSRYKSVAQLGFLLSHGLGVLLGTMYDSKTPDLYPNNAHHRLGWVLTWISLVHFMVGRSRNLSRKSKRFAGLTKWLSGRQTLLPLSPSALEEQRPDSGRLPKLSRLSSDSHQGIEPYEASLAGPSVSSESSLLTESWPAHRMKDNEKPMDSGLNQILRVLALRKSWGAERSCASNKLLFQAQRLFFFIYTALERLLVVLGFTALCTGIATFGRLFVSHKTPSHRKNSELSLHRKAKTC